MWTPPILDEFLRLCSNSLIVGTGGRGRAVYTQVSLHRAGLLYHEFQGAAGRAGYSVVLVVGLGPSWGGRRPSLATVSRSRARGPGVTAITGDLGR